MNESPSIWITGVGAVSALGLGFDEISKGLLAGKSGIRPVADFDVAQHPCRIAGQVTLPPAPPELNPTAYEKLWPLERCIVFCCLQALLDSGLWANRGQLRIGLVLGVAAEWMSHWDWDARHGGRMIGGPTTGYQPAITTVQEMLGLNGPAMSVAAACASGNQAIGLAREWLAMDWVDVCLAGACDMGVTPYSMASFGNLRALSRRNDEPTAAVRPFDADRDGMVLGEGGAVFALERSNAVRGDDRHGYAEVGGAGMTSDSYHLVSPDPNSTYAAAAVRHALHDAQVDVADIDYINAHATGTPVGDACEARMLHAVLGPHVARPAVSSTKSMTGHLLGAAAAIEALACLTAIKFRAIPPTINLDRPDTACRLNHVANVAREQAVRVAVSNSFGFGGHNTSLVLKAVA
ncbi:MAG TPA: beta-ketoacyl-[acyl-carrier-protein] synthase family protein [Pirellulales bacterium]|nr:beta-ketoacyl-[acyl-carrier-protein] synthase family protein [Pirellulales bacterium]